MNKQSIIQQQKPLQKTAKTNAPHYRVKKTGFSMTTPASKNETIEIRVQLSSRELEKLLKN